MIAGAAESCIHPLAFAGFERLRGLTTSSNENPERALRPFSDDRDGFVIGEGAGVMVLEVRSPFPLDPPYSGPPNTLSSNHQQALTHAKSREANVLAVLAGHASTSDAHHPTQPLESGESAARCMRLALNRAQVSWREVDWINAHATSTPAGDVAENRAIKALLNSPPEWRMHDAKDEVVEDDLLEKPWEDVCVSSTKGATGHLLGAAGALEAVFSVCAIVDVCVECIESLSSECLDEKCFDVSRGRFTRDLLIYLVIGHHPPDPKPALLRQGGVPL